MRESDSRCSRWTRRVEPIHVGNFRITVMPQKQRAAIQIQDGARPRGKVRTRACGGIRCCAGASIHWPVRSSLSPWYMQRTQSPSCRPTDSAAPLLARWHLFGLARKGGPAPAPTLRSGCRVTEPGSTFTNLDTKNRVPPIMNQKVHPSFIAIWCPCTRFFEANSL